METIEGYLEALASAEPTPGGGSAATIVAAEGAALVAMVARLTLANAKHADKRSEAERLIAAADRVRKDLLSARRADEAAYAQVVAAQALPRATPQEKAARASALQAALAGAAEEPLRTAALAVHVVRLANEALRLENPGLASDVGCAAEFGAAALAAAAYNVRINHAYLRDGDLIERQSSDLGTLEGEGLDLLGHVRSALN